MEATVAAKVIGKLVPSEARHSRVSIEIILGLELLKQILRGSAVNLKRNKKCGEFNRDWQRCSDIPQGLFVACEIGLSAVLLEG